jgi:2-polyprenyl-3-methyl-5-hydroxy-6-metoxy-1,4-benzoquinol methylase
VGQAAGLRELLGIYDDASFGFRAFLVHRWWHASLPAIEQCIPRGASVVELGCGHGIFANFIGLRDPGRSVLALEQNEEKAAFAAGRVTNVRVETKDVRGIHVGEFDAVALVDVLHHLTSYEQQEELLDSALEMLRPGGTLIVKEVSKSFPVKFQLTLVLDRIAYPGDTFYFRRHEEFHTLLERRGLTVEYKNLSSHVPYAHVMFVCKKR